MRLSLSISLCVMFLFSSVIFAANGDLGAGSGADGSEGSPWLIEDFADFEAFCGDTTKWAAGQYTRLEADIDLDPSLPGRVTYSQAPIAGDGDSTNLNYFDGTRYSGNFNGNGHIFSNLTIKGGYYLGLFGYVNKGEIINLGLKDVNVKGTGACVGGLCGRNSGEIKHCYSTGSITGDYRVGGLCGNNNRGIIIQCYSACEVTGDWIVGGLSSDNWYGTITQCFSTGAVTGYDNSIGGLCGDNWGGTVSDCFWDIDTSGRFYSNGGWGLTSDQMKRAISYIGWLDGNWTILEGVDYPRLSWETAGGNAIVTNYPTRTYLGSGTEEDPYRISTVTDIECLGYRTDDWDSNIILEKNIDLSGNIFSHSLFAHGGYFTGSFDGNGKVINNLYIQSPAVYYVGLFYRLGSGGVVKNLGLKNMDVTGYCYVGGLCGYSEGDISQCYAIGSVMGEDYVGGLCGQNQNLISQCYTTVSVQDTGEGIAGGLCGDNGGTISQCYAAGKVTGSDYNRGFCGDNYGTISISFWDVEVSGLGQSGDDNYGATGKNTLEMQTLSTFTDAGWDFVDIDGNPADWQILEGFYPRLEWEPLTVITMPDVTGLELLLAKSELETLGLVVEQEYVFNGTIPKGEVIEQSLEIGLVTFSGETVLLYVSGGLGVWVPDISGMTQLEAETAIVNEGLTTGSVRYEYSVYSVDRAAYSEPSVDTRVVEGEIVNIIISQGIPAKICGHGTEGDPYRIMNLNHFNEFCDITNKGKYWTQGVYSRLEADIDLDPALPGRVVYDKALIACDEDNTNWSSFDGIAYSGKFNGNDHTISNLTIDTSGTRSCFLGMFGVIEGVNAEVKNLILVDVNITGADNSVAIGALCGTNGNWAIGGKINNCSTSGSIMVGYGSSYIGGMCGISIGNIETREGTIVDSHSSCSVTGAEDTYKLGGLCGNSAESIIDNCHASGQVSGLAGIGGLCGRSSSNTISDCFAIGSVYGAAEDIGVFCGSNEEGVITNCYATGIVTGDDSVGGFCGYVSDGTNTNCYASCSVMGGVNSEEVGGFCGTNDYGTISNCYSSGSVTSGEESSIIGGFCGYNNESSISNCYSICLVAGGENSFHIGGLCGGNSNGVISNSYATGDITGGSILGGLCGSSSSESSISNCYAAGNITGADGCEFLGGLCGDNWYGSFITNCYATGIITGGNNSYFLGGLCGQNHTGTISKCYAIGNVIGGDGSNSLSGFCGINEDGIIIDCFWDTDTSGTSIGYNQYPGSPDTINNVQGQSTILMQTQSTYTDEGWDFSDDDGDAADWFYGGGYPLLRWQVLTGSGTEGNSYLIEDLDDFYTFCDLDYSEIYWAEGVYTRLETDLDLAGRTYTTAVIAPEIEDTSFSFDGIPYSGNFDGNGFVISNLTIITEGEYSEYLGLFGVIGGESAEVNNFGVVDFSITIAHQASCIGGLCGSNGDNADLSGSISDCYTTGSITSDQNSSGELYSFCRLGGLCGYSYGKIDKCYSECKIYGEGDSGEFGGLCGYNRGLINNSYATGSISGGGTLGGLCGSNGDWEYAGGNISNSYATGDITGNSAPIGGLCGHNEYGTIDACYATGLVSVAEGSEGGTGGLLGYNNEGIVTNCYATGSVNGGEDTIDLGGVCGNNSGIVSYCYSSGSVTGGDNSYSLGGLCGYNGNTVSDCYSTGTVAGGNGSEDIGGLVGVIEYGVINNCYSTGNVAGGNYANGLIGGAYSNYNEINNSFWDVETSGIADPEAGFEDADGMIGLSTSEMQDVSPFTGVGWDFIIEEENGAEDIWHMPYHTTGYPILYWQRDIPGDYAGEYGVDMEDIGPLAAGWLDSYDIEDLTEMAANWLAGK